MEDQNLLTFSTAEKHLFSELIISIICLLWPSRVDATGRGKKLENPLTFSVHDYVGGQADMSCDQETHLMLEYCGIIDRNQKLLFNEKTLRTHLNTKTEYFGVDLLWVIECYFSTIIEWHGDKEKFKNLISPNTFTIGEEFKTILSLFSQNNMVDVNKNKAQWKRPIKSILGIGQWGIYTHNGEQARTEISDIWSMLPDKMQQLIISDVPQQKIFDEFYEKLSNHWYEGDWHDEPIRGEREAIYMRDMMHSRALYIWEMVHKYNYYTNFSVGNGVSRASQ